MEIRVVVVDDHEIVRVGLKTILDQEPDIHVVGLASTGNEALRLVEDRQPDVAVVDYGLTGMSGEELCRLITERHPNVPVIMLSTVLQEEVVSQSMQAGAKAYVYKDVEGQELKRTIRMVAQGQSVLDPRVAAGAMRGADGRLLDPLGGRRLSKREIEVLRLVMDGLTNTEIAGELGVTQNTVKTYVRRALEKLECDSRAEAAAAASRRGLL